MAEQPRMNKKDLSIARLSHGENDDVQYWLSKTPEERLNALELTRQALYGYDAATAKLKRVLEIARLEK